MISAKRISLQLTPLLDLLLIVIFAQYLEIEQTTTAENKEYAAQQARQQYQLQQLQSELSFTKQVLKSTQERRNVTETELDSLKKQQESERADSLTQREELNTRLRDVSLQRDRIIAAVKEIYANSSAEIQEMLTQLSQTPGVPQPISPDQIQSLASEISESTPRDLATFLLAYEEIRKRCDIWEIHLDPQGLIHVFDGVSRHTFRAGTAEDFQRQLFELYKSLPQTKGLVIMLVSYGEVRADLRQNVLLSMPTVTDRMRTDAAGRTRFEYAIIGYLPQPPAPAAEPQNQP